MHFGGDLTPLSLPIGSMRLVYLPTSTIEKQTQKQPNAGKSDTSFMASVMGEKRRLSAGSGGATG